MNRREALRTIAAGSASGALAAGIAMTATPSAVASAPNLEVLKAYDQWLFYERRLLLVEAFPLMPLSFVHGSTAADRYHFPTDGDWRDRPQPSTRANLVLSAIGIDPTAIRSETA